jgi:hypothetical protein
MNPSTNPDTNLKKTQMDTFRDELNKQLFEEGENNVEIDQAKNTLRGIVSNTNSNQMIKKEYKAPPKIFKRPDLNIETKDSNQPSNNNIYGSSQPLNPLSKTNSDRELNELFSSNQPHIDVNKSICSIKESQKEKYQLQGNTSPIGNNNISFSEENCNSVTYSENKDSKMDHSESSIDKSNLIKDNNFSIPSVHFDSITKNNQNNINQPHMHKIEKTTKFTKLEKTTTNSNNTKTVTINSPIISTKNRKNNSSLKDDNLSLKSYKSENKSKNDDIYVNKDKLTISEDQLQNNLNTSVNNLNVSITSTELSKKLDKLKNEIRDLKETKVVLETNYRIEVNKNDNQSI